VKSMIRIVWIFGLFMLGSCLAITPGSITDDSPDFIPATDITHDAQIFKTYGGDQQDRGINLIQTQDGGFAIVGYSSSFGNAGEDVYLVRTDPNGKELWSKTYGGDSKDNGWDLIETDDGGLLIAGFTNSFGAGKMDFYLLLTDSKGNLVWERTYGGPEDDFAWALSRSSDGGYILGGQTESYGEGDKDGYLVKVNSLGEEIWSQTYGGPEEDRLYSIDNGLDGGFVLTGTTTSFGAANRNAYIIKTDESGDLVWMNVFGEDQDDVGHSIRRSGDGGYLMTGYTQSYGAANYDSWIMKLNESGDFIWQQIYGGPQDDRTISGEQTSDGGFILTGYTRSFGSIGWDIFLVRSDMSGEVLWHKTFGGNKDDTGYTVKPTNDNAFILTGETYSIGEGNGDMFLIMVDDN